MKKLSLLKSLMAAGLVAMLPAGLLAVPDAVTYQAQLLDPDGDPIVSNSVNVTLGFYPTELAAVAMKTVTFPGLDLDATNGFINVEVNSSGLVFDGEIFVEVTVQDNNTANPPEVLAPRQRITTVPFAFNSQLLDGESLADIQAYADTAAATTGGAAGFGNFNRIVVVNPSITQSATPDGTFLDPFDNIADAYAHARDTYTTSFFNRAVVYLMPGEHQVTSTVVLDRVGVDIIGFGDKTAFIRGTADPLLRVNATDSGPVIRNLQVRPNPGTNAAIEVLTSTRIENVQIGRAGGAGNDLVVFNLGATETASLRGFEVYGNVQVPSYGSQVTISQGFITGTLNITGSSTTTQFVGLSDLSNVGALTFNPSAVFGVLGMTNVTTVGGFSYGANSVIRAQGVGFVDAAFAPIALTVVPLNGSLFINCMADFTAVTASFPAQSTGNVLGAYIAFASR